MNRSPSPEMMMVIVMQMVMVTMMIERSKGLRCLDSLSERLQLPQDRKLR